MTIYHLAVLALILVPLAAWAYRSSTNRSIEQTDDLPKSALAARTVAVALGFTALYSITSQSLLQASIQAFLWMVISLVVFGIAWLGLRVLGRRFSAPRRKLFELWLFLLALSIVMVLVNVQMDKIQNS